MKEAIAISASHTTRTFGTDFTDFSSTFNIFQLDKHLSKLHHLVQSGFGLSHKK